MSLDGASPELNVPPTEGEGVRAGPSLRPGQTVGNGRFRIERVLGRGGMGTVWEAFDERLREPVALKFVSERIRGNPAALEALRRETSRCHSLSHPHIVRIHDLHEAAGEPAFISMEYVDGPNLHEVAGQRANRAFPWDDVWAWLRPLGEALGYAHSRGVIHRDLKPANLMLTSRGELKLADFGLAAAREDSAASASSSISGTIAYMSPQQFAGAPAAVTDDLYSLGACLFELLTGVPPFRGPEVGRQIEFEPAPLLSTTLQQRGLECTVPEPIEDLILQCLSKNPTRRPPSALALLEMAKAGLAERDQRPENQSPGAGTRPRSWRRRVGRPVLIGVVVGLLGLAFGLKTAYSRRAPAAGRAAAPGLAGAVVRCSSFQSPSSVEGAFDGIHRIATFQESNRWVSSAFVGDRSDWIAVDLGRDLRITSVAIDWELAFAKDFTVRTRTGAEGFGADPEDWRQRGAVAGFGEAYRTAVNETNHIDDVVFDFAGGVVRMGDWMSAQRAEIDSRPPVARHVMIQATARGGNNPGVYSIWEVQIATEPADLRP